MTEGTTFFFVSLSFSVEAPISDSNCVNIDWERFVFPLFFVHLMHLIQTRGAWAPVSLHRPDFSVTVKRSF